MIELYTASTPGGHKGSCTREELGVPGQTNVFFRYCPEKIQPAIDRYQDECRRLFEVLVSRLGASGRLADDVHAV